MGADPGGRRRSGNRQATSDQQDHPRQPSRCEEGPGGAAHRGGPGTARRHEDDGRRLFHEWIKELERKGRSPNTIHNYAKVYRHDIAATLGTVPVSKVTTKMLTDLYGAPAAGREAAHPVPPVISQRGLA